MLLDMRISSCSGMLPPGLEYVRLDAGARRPLAYFPGLTDALFSPAELLRRRKRLFAPWLTARTVYIVSRRRPLPSDWSIAKMAADYAQALGAIVTDAAPQDGRIDVAGASFGGCIALRFGVDHPDLVRRLVVQQAAAMGDPDAALTLRRWVEYLEGGKYLRFATSVVSNTSRGRQRLWNDSVAVGTYPLVLRDFHRRRGDLLTTLRAVEGFDVREELHRIQAPTLIVGGARDQLVPTRLLEATASAIDGSRLLVFPEASHSVQAEHTRAYGTAISEFLD